MSAYSFVCYFITTHLLCLPNDENSTNVAGLPLYDLGRVNDADKHELHQTLKS